jgi:hypothetical protein
MYFIAQQSCYESRIHCVYNLRDSPLPIFFPGVITVANPDVLDREVSERLRVIVIATTTSGAYDYATVWISVIDINDNGPRFAQERYLSKVYENSPRGTFVAQVRVHLLDRESEFRELHARWSRAP